MANDLNQCNFTGRLGADPEIRYMSDQTPIANMRLAVGKQWKDKQTGEKREQTEWVTVVAFRKLAEIAGEYFRKGGRLLVVGEMRTRKWQDKEGHDRYSTEIVADKILMLDSNPQSEARQPAPRQQAKPRQGGSNGFDEDIPFQQFEPWGVA